ncbi:uncharacterized protein [Henckelia pumila]|uniref:uncharacterized protein n=1 Tax=Henckelia pumila TaxID=405737 RepID=UPI003C6DC903
MISPVLQLFFAGSGQIAARSQSIVAEFRHGAYIRRNQWPETPCIQVERSSSQENLFKFPGLLLPQNLRAYDQARTEWCDQQWFLNGPDLNSVRCRLLILPLLHQNINPPANLIPEIFPPEEIESLAENIADLILTGFRFKRTTSRGEGPKPVIVVEVYRTKTLDFTQVGSDDDDYWQEIYEKEIEKQFISHECHPNSLEDCISSEYGDEGIGESSDEIWKVAYENEVLDILRSIKCHMKICQRRCLRAMRDDEPKGLYEVKRRVEMKVCRMEELTMEDCPVCLQRFGDGVEIVETPCSHVFHAQCIFAWLLKNISCPMCRSVCIKFV